MVNAEESQRLSLWQRNTNNPVSRKTLEKMERAKLSPRRVFINNIDSYSSKHIAKVKTFQCAITDWNYGYLLTFSYRKLALKL